MPLARCNGMPAQRKKTTRSTRSARTRARSPARASASRTSSQGRASSARSRSKPQKDPRGGLTAEGRKAFARSTGAHLQPGVKKKVSEMTPAEMRRKGSWAVRFYGRAGKLPPLLDEHGEPTRFAKTAAAWGEPVPRTVAAARRIAAKGRRLLERYRLALG